MKKIIYIILALSLVTFSCKNRKEQKRQKVQVTDKAETPVATENPAMTEEAPASVTMLEEDDFGSLVLIFISTLVQKWVHYYVVVSSYNQSLFCINLVQ